MKLKQLIYNGEFSFNPEFKVIMYEYPNNAKKVVYDSRVSPDCPYEYLDWRVEDINQDEDGTISIVIDFL